MPTTIPQQYLDLFQKKAFAHLATLMRDGGLRYHRCGATSMAHVCGSTPPRVG